MASQWEHIKWIPGTPFMVDGFKFQSPKCKHYFLTHYHADHTIGLGSGFSAGTIYCSHVTANLLIRDMRVNPGCIRALPLDTELFIEGISVTLIDANHCPGAVLLLFKTPPPKSSIYKHEVILHTGDMRWSPQMGKHPALANQRIDQLFLDTTYASPKHTFPSQERAICKIVELMSKHAAQEPRTLFVMGSYRIGKERAYLGAAKALGYRCHVNADKLRVLRLLGLPEADLRLITKDKSAARIHVSFMGKVFLPENLRERIANTEWTQLVAFRPTGWSFQKKGVAMRKEGNVIIYGIPYSEHSSYNELRDCVRTLRPRKLIPTVNAADKASAQALADRFADLMDHRNNRSKMDFFLRPAQTVPPLSSKAGSEGQPQAACLGRAGTAPAAAGASEHMSEAPASAAHASLPSEGLAADVESENAEALYWKQHGQVEEDLACEDAWGWDQAGDLDHLDASWRSEPEEDEKPDDGGASEHSIAAREDVAHCNGNPIKLELAASCTGCQSTLCIETLPQTVLYTAGATHKPPEQGAAGSAGCVPKPAQEALASLQRFSYSGSSPLKNESSSLSCEHSSHAVQGGSQHSRVLVKLGLDSPKAQLPSSMAPYGRPTCPSAGRGSSMQGQPLCKPEEVVYLQACRQQVPAPIKQEDSMSTCQEHPGTALREGEALPCKVEPMRAQQEAQPDCASPDSWATATEGSQQNSQQQQAPPLTHGQTRGDPCPAQSSPQARSEDCPVTDICSPQPASCRRPPCTRSMHIAGGELSSRGAKGMRSPRLGDCIDLSAVDLVEQQRILGIIAAQRKLQEELQASRACPQLPSARVCLEQSMSKRSRAVIPQSGAALPAVVPVKRRQLGIGAFLLNSQQRSARR